MNNSSSFYFFRVHYGLSLLFDFAGSIKLLLCAFIVDAQYYGLTFFGRVSAAFHGFAPLLLFFVLLTPVRLIISTYIWSCKIIELL